MNRTNAKPEPDGESILTSPQPLVLAADDGQAITSDQFQRSFGEDIRRTLDMDTWRVGVDLTAEYNRIDSEVREAIERESAFEAGIRHHVFPRLRSGGNLPKNAGVYPVKRETLEEIHRGLLFNGGVEACDGVLRVHDTLPLTIYQLGVSLVSYQGNQGTWGQRLFRRDLRQATENTVEDVIAALEQRRALAEDDRTGELVQKTLLTVAERTILLRRSTAVWRMGLGNPVSYELLTGGAIPELMLEGTRVLRELIEIHQKFVFIGAEPRNPLMRTIGQALPPWHFAIVQRLSEQIDSWLQQQRFTIAVGERLTWDGETISAAQWIPRFIKSVAGQVVVGVFRASEWAPPQLFFAHEGHADLAAHIVLADAMLQEHRGTPLLADLAGHVCSSVFGSTLDTLAETAYASAGAPWRYAMHRSSTPR